MAAAVFSLPALVLGPWKRHSVSVHHGAKERRQVMPSTAIARISEMAGPCGERRTSKELAGGAGDSDDKMRLLVVQWLLLNSTTNHDGNDDDMRLSST
ncbi:hypothetical protein CKAH01_05959 [Colletotrichum kahawae]|uniref:Uncharacterized protein n=1 Tax=Colletotrichum kahawae TaxID=34407 RepID=A0AAE0D4X2_COLKA|nr:hypothetical protein CKAH01_05959 [Colletotrichum kahawae]